MAYAWVGTSGFNYRHWRGVLYPEGLPQHRWMEHYAAHYNSVELNVTFYGLPKPGAFAGWAARTPRDFAFALKGSRFITHIQRLARSREALQRFFAAAAPLGPRLRGALWQLPPDMVQDVGRLAAFLQALRDVAPPGCHQAFEFRHQSWYAEPVFRLLDEAGAAVVYADWPLQVLPPGMRARPLGRRPVVRAPLTAPFAYVRRHGPGARYASGYPRAMVRSDAHWARRWRDEGRDVFAFYNNDGGGHAVRDAAALARALDAVPVAPRAEAVPMAHA